MIEKQSKEPLIVLAGPTAVGKTKLSISLAKALDGEIISADSMQVYRDMNIGTAKISREEMEGVSHHLIDVLDPQEEFNVVLFQQLATKAIADIRSRGKLPILVGGTGFYIQAVSNAISFTESETDDAYRTELMQFAKDNGAQALHERLIQVDPEAAKQIHANNIKRTIRALEFFHLTGEKISKHNEEQKQHESPYHLLYFVLTAPRDVLYDRINCRVDDMIRQGLVDEVKRLRARGFTREMVSMQGLGYKEIFAYLDGETTLEEAIEALKQATRHFAKRQLTWFKREKQVIWVDKSDYAYQEDKILEHMLDIIKNEFVKENNHERI